MPEKNKLSYQEISKLIYTPNTATETGVQIGALLRIARATEAMAHNYERLLEDLEWYKKRKFELEAELRLERKRTAAYRGFIKRMKRNG